MSYFGQDITPIRDWLSASTTQKGILEFATQAEALALVDPTRAISPETLKQVFSGTNVSIASSGRQKLPSGIIVQWGSVSYTDIETNLVLNVTFPLTFPTGTLQFYQVVDTSQYGVTSIHNSVSASGATVVVSEPDTIFTGGIVRWLAIGH